MKKLLLFAVLFSATFLAQPSQSEWVWRNDSGWVNLRQPPVGSLEERYNHAVALMSKNNHSTALEQLEKIVPDASGDFLWKTRMRMAECKISLRKYGEASELAHSILIEGFEWINPHEAWRVRLEAAEAGLNHSYGAEAPRLLRTIQAAPEETWTAETLLDAADLCLRHELYDQGINLLNKLRNRFPDDALAAQALLMSADSMLEISAENNLSGEYPRRTASIYEDYYAETTETIPPAMVEQIALIKRIAEEENSFNRQALYAFALVTLGNYSMAADISRPVAEARKGHPTGEAAAYCLATALYEDGRPAESLDAALDLIETYPKGQYYDDTQMIRFHSSVSLMEMGKKRGQREMEKIFNENPRGPLADRSLLEQGKYMLSQGRHVQARRLFESILEDFPGRGTYAEAIFRQGQARLGQSRYHPQNQEVYQKAAESFEIYIMQYPHGEFAEEAQELLAECYNQKANHMLEVARFYRKRGRHEAAFTYLELVVRDYPETPAAEQAEEMLAEREAAN